MTLISIKYSIFRLLTETKGRIPFGGSSEDLIKQALDTLPTGTVRNREYQITAIYPLGTVFNHEAVLIELARTGAPPNLRPVYGETSDYAPERLGFHIRCIYLPKEAMLFVPHGVDNYTDVKQPAGVIAKLVQKSDVFSSAAPYSVVSAGQISRTTEALEILSNTRNDIRSITLTLPSPNPITRSLSIPKILREAQHATNAGPTSLSFASKEIESLVPPKEDSIDLRQIWIDTTKEIQRLGGEIKGKYIPLGETTIQRFGKINVIIVMRVSQTVAYDFRDTPPSPEAVASLLPQLEARLTEEAFEFVPTTQAKTTPPAI